MPVRSKGEEYQQGTWKVPASASLAHVKRSYPIRCIGCGKFWVRICGPCGELQKAYLERIAKLRGTVEGVFAEKRNA